MIFEYQPKKGSVYLLFNEANSKYRFRAAKFVMGKGFSPLYPSIEGDLFTVKTDRKKAVDSRTNLIRKSNEIWVFGEINATMWDLINYAKNLKKRVRHFYVLDGQFWEKEEEEPVRTF